VKKLLFLLLAISLGGCSSSISERDLNLVEKVVSNLDAPWSIAKDGELFFITERSGSIVKVMPNGTSIREAVELSVPLSTVAEAGLMGLGLKKDFSISKEAFAYYTYDVGGAPINRVVTLRYNGDSWIETAIHLDGVSSGSVHHGGRIALSPDGVLFVTIGDGADPKLAQDLNSFNGKIVALKEDGSFHIYSYGHRNPQGLAWDENGILYESEHGQSANDEINIIKEGHNYGWPIIEGTETASGMEAPILTSGSQNTWAPSGMTFHKGLLYVAALRGKALLVINPNEYKIIGKIEGYGRVRDVYSDGEFIYFITNNTDGRGQPSEDDDVLYKLNRQKVTIIKE
jgi:glucose/arabinose dehydrogenase